MIWEDSSSVFTLTFVVKGNNKAVNIRDLSTLFNSLLSELEYKVKNYISHCSNDGDDDLSFSFVAIRKHKWQQWIIKTSCLC